jgi:toxin ParE1/3/4
VPTYKLRPQAAADLRSIRRWIAKDDPHRARTFVVELTEHFQRLADHHVRHRVITDLGADIRLALHGNYNIYYRFFGDAGRDVLVIRVLHGARDLSRIVMD